MGSLPCLVSVSLITQNPYFEGNLAALPETNIVDSTVPEGNLKGTLAVSCRTEQDGSVQVHVEREKIVDFGVGTLGGRGRVAKRRAHTW